MQYTYNDETGELVLTATDPGQEVVNNSVVKLYYHHDHLGSTDYLTDNVDGKVVSYVTYDDWGALTAKAVLKCGVRELDLVQSYTTYAYDMVLDVYFAQARTYDAGDRRFMAVDTVTGSATAPMTLVQYLYVQNNPLIFTDPTGEIASAIALAAYEVAEIAAMAVVTVVAVYLVSPAGQKAIQEFAALIDSTITGFVSTAEGILDQLEEVKVYFNTIRCAITDNIDKIAAETADGIRERLEINDHTVYVHIDTTTYKVWYVGRTNDFERRYKEHARIVNGLHASMHPIGPDVGREMYAVVTGLTQDKAKITEQILIAAYTLEALDNARNEIAAKNWSKVWEEANRISEMLSY